MSKFDGRLYGPHALHDFKLKTIFCSSVLVQGCRKILLSLCWCKYDENDVLTRGMFCLYRLTNVNEKIVKCLSYVRVARF